MSPLLLLACAGGPAPDGADDTSGAGDSAGDTAGDSANPGAVTCDGEVIRTTCPDDAVTFDVADARNVVSVDLDWRWSAACFLSVADPVYVRVPEDGASLTATVDAVAAPTFAEIYRDGVQQDLGLPGAVVPVSAATTFAFPERPEAPEVDGCWAIFPTADATTPDALSGQLDLYVRRGDATTGVLRVVGVVVDDAAMTEADIDAVLSGVIANYAVGGLAVELAATETLTYQPGVPLGTGAAREALLRSWTDPNGTEAVPIFFVPEYDTSGVIGIAGGIPGAPRPGTASAGVTVAVEPLWDFANDAPDLDQMTQVVTHELGHQLGLWHTTERTGLTFDTLDDTPECTIDYDADGDLVVQSGECDDAGADYVMFWQSRGYDQTILSDDERWVVARGGAVREE